MRQLNKNGLPPKKNTCFYIHKHTMREYKDTDIIQTLTCNIMCPVLQNEKLTDAYMTSVI